MQLTQLPGFWAAIGSKMVDLSPTADNFEIRLTNSFNASWATVADLAGSLVDVSALGDLTLPIASFGINLAGNNKQDSTVADKDFTATGAAVGPFRYIWIVDPAADVLCAYGDFGSAQSIPDGQALQFRPTGAANVVYQVSNSSS